MGLFACSYSEPEYIATGVRDVLAPIKYYFFVCYSPVGFMNGSPVGYKSQLIWILICKSCSTDVL